MYKPRRDSYSDRNSGGGRFGGDSSYPRRENRDRGSFGGGRGGDREDRPSFEAICAKCDKPCRVPFRPNGTKPVLCKVCFEQEGGPKPSFRDRPSFGGDRGGFGGGRDRDDRPSFRSDRPVTRTLGDRDIKPSRLEEQVTRLEAKIDALLLKLGATVTAPAPKKDVVAPTSIKTEKETPAPEKKKSAKKEEKKETKVKKTKKAKAETSEEIAFN
jgi:CxxC-x17-CxxC domain-containing protein